MKKQTKISLALCGVVALVSLGVVGVTYADTTTTTQSINSFCGKLSALAEKTRADKITVYSNMMREPHRRRPQLIIKNIYLIKKITKSVSLGMEIQLKKLRRKNIEKKQIKICQHS